MFKVMVATGQEKIKGSLGYSFALSTSTKTEVDKEMLKEYYQEAVNEALKDILPADVSVTLTASVSKLEEGAELPDGDSDHPFHQTPCEEGGLIYTRWQISI